MSDLKLPRDLVALRDHARRMADGEKVRVPLGPFTPHDNAVRVAGKSQVIVSNEADRPLWRKIADEIDAYLTERTTQQDQLI